MARLAHPPQTPCPAQPGRGLSTASPGSGGSFVLFFNAARHRNGTKNQRKACTVESGSNPRLKRIKMAVEPSAAHAVKPDPDDVIEDAFLDACSRDVKREK